MKFDQEFPGGIKTRDCFRRLLYTGNKMDGNPIFFYFTQLSTQNSINSLCRSQQYKKVCCDKAKFWWKPARPHCHPFLGLGLATFCYAKKFCTAESIARINHGLIAIIFINDTFYFDLSVNAGTTRAG